MEPIVEITMDNFFDQYMLLAINTIKKNKHLSNTYNTKHLNSKYSLEEILKEIFYVLRTGVPWRLLRSPINWKTIYWHFSRFKKHQIFQKTFNKLIKNNYTMNNNIIITDTTFIYNKFGKNKISRNKYFKNKKCNKLSIITDDIGVPLSVYINKGSIHDLHYLTKHTNDIITITKNKKTLLLADKCYESIKMRNALDKLNITLMIQKKKRAKANYYYDKYIYKKRIIVENTFQKLKNFRRVMIRYDKLFSTYKEFCFIAASIIFLQTNKSYKQ